MKVVIPSFLCREKNMVFSTPRSEYESYDQTVWGKKGPNKFLQVPNVGLHVPVNPWFRGYPRKPKILDFPLTKAVLTQRSIKIVHLVNASVKKKLVKMTRFCVFQ